MDPNSTSPFTVESDHVVPAPKSSGFLLSHAGLILFAATYILFLGWLWPRKAKAETIPRIPWSIPIVRSTVALLFDGYRMFKEIPRLYPNHQTVRIDILQDEVYAVQGPKNVAEVFRNPVLTNNQAYSLFLEQCYGMDKNAAKVFLDDASGLRDKPMPGAAVPEERIYHKTHKNLIEGLIDKGLPSAMENTERTLLQALEDLPVGDEWVQMPDLSSFFEHLVGTSLIEALYGRRLLEEDPEFMNDLWTFDHSIIGLLRRLPSFLYPEGYSVRKKLLAKIKRWQLNGLKLVGTEQTAAANNEDAIWGSYFMKERFHMFLGAPGQDQDSIASLNLGLFWGTVVNVVPSSKATLINVLQDPKAHAAIRELLDAAPAHPSRSGLDMAKVEKIPLVLSVYAETLRTILQIHVPRVAKHHEVRVNGATIPRNKLILANMMIAHMDTEVWNTQDGKHPVDTFWAERFIVDPRDPTSGPVTQKIREKLTYTTDEAHYSTEGLEGAYIPFGGGKYACPGRKLARRVTLSSLAMLITKFDIELLTEGPVSFDSPRFGLSVKAPKGPVPFQIRRRSS